MAAVGGGSVADFSLPPAECRSRLTFLRASDSRSFASCLLPYTAAAGVVATFTGCLAFFEAPAAASSATLIAGISPIILLVSLNAFALIIEVRVSVAIVSIRVKILSKETQQHGALVC